MSKKDKIETSVIDDIEGDSTTKKIMAETDSELLRAMEILQNPKNIESNTILDNYQVNALTMMNWAGQVYDIEFFKQYVALYPKYRISGDDGRGRKEIIQIAEALSKEKLEQQNRIIDMLRR